MPPDYSEFDTEVTRAETLDAAMIVFADQLEANANDPVAIKAFATRLRSTNDSIAARMLKGTPQDPTAPVDPETPVDPDAPADPSDPNAAKRAARR